MYMNTWMVPRNIRRLTKIPQILSSFFLTIEDGEKWGGNRELQRKFEIILEESGIKGRGQPWDANSGGARTFIAQLKALGLIFLDTTVDPPVHRTTLAGEAIINGENPITILQYQLLKLQYPSPYSASQGVNISPEFKIRPVVFVCKLLLDNDIAFITKKEFGRFVIVYGKTEEDFSYVKDLILDYRRDPENYVLPATFMQDSCSARTTNHSLEKRITHLEDIANTFFNYLDSTQLVIRPESADKIQIDPVTVRLIKSFIDERRPLIRYDDDDIAFQRKYGVDPKHTKDTRRFNSGTVNDNLIIEKMVMTSFFNLASTSIISDINNEVVDAIYERTGIRKEDIIRILERKHPEGLSYFEESFLNMSKKGKEEAIDFEKAVAKIFQSMFGYKAKHIGQTKPKNRGSGGNADVIIISTQENYSGIIDAKAYSSYSITNDHKNRLLHNYISNAVEYSEEKPIKFFMYVSGGFSSAFNEGLADMCRASKLSGSGITAKNLIRLTRKVKETEITHSQLLELFSKGFEITSIDIENIGDLVI